MEPAGSPPESSNENLEPEVSDGAAEPESFLEGVEVAVTDPQAVVIDEGSVRAFIEGVPGAAGLKAPPDEPVVDETQTLANFLLEQDRITPVPEALRLPAEAWYALAVCLARQSRMRRFFKHVPTDAVAGGDKYTFRLVATADGPVVDLTIMRGFIHVSTLSDRLREATMHSGNCHRRKESARQMLERCKSEEAQHLRGPEREFDTEPEPGTPRAVSEETKKRLLANTDKALLELNQATSDAESASETVKEVQALIAGVVEERKRITLADIEFGRVLPVFAKQEAQANVA